MVQINWGSLELGTTTHEFIIVVDNCCTQQLLGLPIAGIYSGGNPENRHGFTERVKSDAICNTHTRTLNSHKAPPALHGIVIDVGIMSGEAVSWIQPH